MNTAGLRRCLAGFSEAEELLESAGGDIARLPEPVRVFLLLHGAQGTIDNGGYEYFFGSNWPGCPNYEDFISAYETIGCHAQAADLRRVVATFPFPDPQLHEDRRKAYIEENYDEDSYSVRGWGNALCGDSDVWEKLADYYESHRNDFETIPKPLSMFWQSIGMIV